VVRVTSGSGKRLTTQQMLIFLGWGGCGGDECPPTHGRKANGQNKNHRIFSTSKGAVSMASCGHGDEQGTWAKRCFLHPTQYILWRPSDAESAESECAASHDGHFTAHTCRGWGQATNTTHPNTESLIHHLATREPRRDHPDRSRWCEGRVALLDQEPRGGAQALSHRRLLTWTVLCAPIPPSRRAPATEPLQQGVFSTSCVVAAQHALSHPRFSLSG
jgi:hypothetical protein